MNVDDADNDDGDEGDNNTVSVDVILLLLLLNHSASKNRPILLHIKATRKKKKNLR